MKNFKVFLLLLLLLLCTGCDSQKREWQTAPVDYTCTVEQMVKAQNEADWCVKNTGYYGTYCYGAAIIRNCEKNGVHERKK